MKEQTELAPCSDCANPAGWAGPWGWAENDELKPITLCGMCGSPVCRKCSWKPKGKERVCRNCQAAEVIDKAYHDRMAKIGEDYEKRERSE